MKTLLTARLRLEPLTENHIDALLEIHKGNVHEFTGRMPRVLKTRREAMRMLIPNARTERYVLVLPGPKAARTVLGVISLSNIDNGVFSNASLGYWINRNFAGYGYTREAAARITKHAFTKLKLHRLEANIAPDNRASIKLVKALGFRKEGVSLRMLFLGDAWRDQARYAMTVEEWTP